MFLLDGFRQHIAGRCFPGVRRANTNEHPSTGESASQRMAATQLGLHFVCPLENEKMEVKQKTKLAQKLVPDPLDYRKRLPHADHTITREHKSDDQAMPQRQSSQSWHMGAGPSSKLQALLERTTPSTLLSSSAPEFYFLEVCTVFPGLGAAEVTYFLVLGKARRRGVSAHGETRRASVRIRRLPLSDPFPEPTPFSSLNTPILSARFGN